jgi:hypothetical protein
LSTPQPPAASAAATLDRSSSDDDDCCTTRLPWYASLSGALETGTFMSLQATATATTTL